MKESIKPVSDDLLDVILGDKPMGYLPLKTVGLCRISLEKTKRLCDENNISYRVYKEGSVIDSGAFVCWNKHKVSEVLLENKGVLDKEGVPFLVDDYIDYVFMNWIDKNKNPNSYKICGFLYGDKNFIPLNIVLE